MWTDIIIAAATVSVAWTAILSIRHEAVRRRERTRVTDAHVSAMCFSLGRQIRSWLSESAWPTEPKAQKRHARELSARFSEAEDRVDRLLSLSPLASSRVAEAVREAATRFYLGTRFISETAGASLEELEHDEAGHPVAFDLPAGVPERFGRSRSLLLAAVEYLDKATQAELKEAGERLE